MSTNPTYWAQAAEWIAAGFSVGVLIDVLWARARAMRRYR